MPFLFGPHRSPTKPSKPKVHSPIGSSLMQRLKACRLGDEPKDSDFSRSAPAPATGDHREGFLHKVATNLKALKSGARNSGDPGQDFGPQKERDVFYSGSVTGLGTSSSFARHKSPSPPPIDLCDFDTEMGSPSTSDPSEFNFELALAGFTIDDYPVLALLSSGDAYRDIGTSKVIKFIEDEPMVDATILEEATEESLDDTVMSDGVPEDLMSIYSEGDRDVDMADVGGSSWARRGMVRRRLQRASALRRSKALSPSMACIPFHPYDRRDRDCHHAASMEDESFNCVPKFVKRAPVIAPSVARVRDTSFQHQAAMYSFGQALEELQLQCQPMTYEQSVWKASEIFTLPPQHRLSHSRSTEERKAHPHAYNPYDMRGRHDWRKREMKKAGQLFPFLAMVSENTTPEPEVCLDPLAELMEGLPIGEEALQTVPSFKDATGTVSDRDAVLFILDAIDGVLHQD